MRTTIRLDDDLLREAKQLAARSDRTLTAVIEDALREVLARAERGERREPFEMPTFKGDGLRPGVSLDSNAELLDLMEEDSPIERRR
jgi:hypothetical protein